MRTGSRRLSETANGTGIQSTGMPLQIDEFHGVERFTALGDSVRTVVASFAIDPTMIRGVTIQYLVLSILGVLMAGMTARLIQPGIRIEFDFIQPTVAIYASHAALRHHVTQAFGRWSWVATVTAFQGRWHLFSMERMHGMRQAGNTRCTYGAQSIRAVTFVVEHRTAAH
jgi:hypothetical protein